MEKRKEASTHDFSIQTVLFMTFSRGTPNCSQFQAWSKISEARRFPCISHSHIYNLVIFKTLLGGYV